MDSLTQITLGAAVGEAVLGKKIGNKAMIWGAVAGTTPDLDVFANLAADEMSALAFHRAITHSVFFAILAPLALGWLAYSLYPGRAAAVVVDTVSVLLAFYDRSLSDWDVRHAYALADRNCDCDCSRL